MSNRYCWAAILVALSAATSAEAQHGGQNLTLRDVPGLNARLTIVNDHDGVPHIRSQNIADAWFGLGFVHARDRLWQLEYLRRAGRGRLAEILGPPALQGDRLFRTLGITQSAAATWTRYPDEHRGVIRSYVAGVNAAVDTQRRNGLPPEFSLLGVEPDRWIPEDVLVLAKVLAWSVDRNWTQEILRVRLTQQVGAERAAFLMPAYTRTDPVIMPRTATSAARKPLQAPSRMQHLDAEILARLHEFDTKVAANYGFGGVGIGSNNQVLASSRTTTGKPILAADPHLPSQIPSIFYVAHVSGAELDAIGATVPGLPGVWMGHNGRVAWGWTNANVDVQDLFIERIDSGGQVEYQGVLEPLGIRQETIRVRGASDVNLTVRSTRHGPLVSDLVDPSGPPLALRWAALDTDDDAGIGAWVAANRAGHWNAFFAAFRKYKAHGQNVLYADVKGNIAYLLTGSIPRRSAGDGTLPVPGWTSAYEWNGYILAEELLRSLNPAQDYLASSNNRIARNDYPHVLGSSYAAPYRAERAKELLAARNRFSPDDLEELQADVLAVHARQLVPLLLRTSPATPREQQALEMLRRWDFRATAESAAAAIFEAWYVQLAETLFADELGDALWRSYSDQMHMVSMAMAESVQTGASWCDDVRTSVVEDCATTMQRALSAALTRMAGEQESSDMGAWQWSRVHRVVFFHQPFDADAHLSSRFSRIYPAAGDKHTLNVASNARWDDYNQRHVALYRQIIDLSDFRNSRWMAAPGQSGLPANGHYEDLVRDWTAGRYRPLLYTRQAIDAQAAERCVLLP